MEVEYLLTVAAARKPNAAEMTRRMESVVRRRRAGPSRGETRWRWSSLREMVRPEVREPSQDWELNIIRPGQRQQSQQLIFPSFALTYKSEYNVDRHQRKSDSQSVWYFTVTHILYLEIDEVVILVMICHGDSH